MDRVSENQADSWFSLTLVLTLSTHTPTEIICSLIVYICHLHFVRFPSSRRSCNPYNPHRPQRLLASAFSELLVEKGLLSKFGFRDRTFRHSGTGSASEKDVTDKDQPPTARSPA